MSEIPDIKELQSPAVNTSSVFTKQCFFCGQEFSGPPFPIAVDHKRKKAYLMCSICEKHLTNRLPKRRVAKAKDMDKK